jgi:8-oxo-dGTP pyrophosphatase MutT (NUDIX family)
MNPRLPELLSKRLEGPLPGAGAQLRFQPSLAYGRHAGPPASDARRASVVVLFYPHDGSWHVPLTLRPDDVPDHAGQVSLPGGAAHSGESSSAAALRELEEELAVRADQVDLLGSLTPLYLFNSNYYVQPWIAAAATRPPFSPQAREVAALLEVPMHELSDPRRREPHRFHAGPLSFTAPAISHPPHVIWGATAMILSEVAALVEDVNP